jgi:hypothetical protein
LGGKLVGEVGVVLFAVVDVDNLGFDDLFELRLQRLDASEARSSSPGVGGRGSASCAGRSVVSASAWFSFGWGSNAVSALGPA